jgi:LPXTG-motif cell wall-anchored protein
MTRVIARVALGGVLLCMTAAVTSAQTTTSATKKFQVIAVDGNQLVVKLPEGTRELTVPDNFQFNVDGKMLSVNELKPGMAGTATITTKTTSVPVTVTEVKNGTVMKALGTAIVVRTDEGMKMFSQSDIDKRGVRIMREGKPAMIADFRENDRLTATIITAQPPRIVTEQEVQATLAKTDAAAPTGTRTAAPASAPSTATPAPAAAPTSGAARKTLPKTASFLPVLPLVGFASLAAGLALAVRRRRTTR